MERLVYKVQDFIKMLGVSYSTACRIIREAKAYRDTLNLRGVILKDDWDAYVHEKSIKNQI